MMRWLWLVPFLAAFGPTLAWLFERYTRSVWENGHGLILPFVLAYLSREELRLDRDPEPHDSTLGFVFLVPALALLALDAAIATQILSAVALVLALPGLALLLLGRRRALALAFPLVIAVFAVPIPAGALTALTDRTRVITTVGADWISPWLGVPTVRDGLLLHFVGGSVYVDVNCSGVTTLAISILAALALAHLVRSRPRRVVLLLVAIPIALAANSLRVAVLIWIAFHFGLPAIDPSVWQHSASGVGAFALSLLVLFAIAGREALGSPPPRAAPVPVSPRYGRAIAVLAVLALVPVGLHSYLHVRGDECANAEALLGSPSAEADPVLGSAVEARLHAFAWRTGRQTAAPLDPPLEWVLARTYDVKSGYYRASARVWDDIAKGKDRTEWLETDDGRIPITRSEIDRDKTTRRQSAVVASLLVYEGAPVEDGVRAQLRAAPRQLVLGARPATLFAVRVPVSSGDVLGAELRARKWLADEWLRYRAFCRVN